MGPSVLDKSVLIVAAVVSPRLMSQCDLRLGLLSAAATAAAA